MRKNRRWAFIRPSTRQFLQEAKGIRRYSYGDLLHGYVYQRWPYRYIGIATGEHRAARVILPVFSMLSKILNRVKRNHTPQQNLDSGSNGRAASPETKGATFADTYHGKVLPLKAATTLVTVEKNISLTDLEHVIPYARARDLILKNPDHIVVLQCPCRTARSHPCTPLDVCLVVGEPFASFISEHHPARSRRITQAEAVEILRAEDERGHVHHAFFKDAMLGRFYAICNCCACCCGAMQAHHNGTPMLASSGYVSSVNEELCVGCGTCSQFCQFKAPTLVNGKNSIDLERCMGCGVCISKCEQGALELVRSPDKGMPLEIRELMAEAAQVENRVDA